MKLHIMRKQVQRNRRCISLYFFDIKVSKDEILQEDILSYKNKLSMEYEYQLEINMEYTRQIGRKALKIKHIQKDFVGEKDYCLSCYYIPVAEKRIVIRVLLLTPNDRQLNIAEVLFPIPEIRLSFDLHLNSEVANLIKTNLIESKPMPQEDSSAPIIISDPVLNISPKKDCAKFFFPDLKIRTSLDDRGIECCVYRKRFFEEGHHNITFDLCCLVGRSTLEISDKIPLEKENRSDKHILNVIINKDESGNLTLAVKFFRLRKYAYPLRESISVGPLNITIYTDFMVNHGSAIFSLEENEAQVKELQFRRYLKRRGKFELRKVDCYPDNPIWIYLYTNKPKCIDIWPRHEYEDVKVHMHYEDGGMRAFEACYCKDCNYYFTTYEAYTQIRRYGKKAPAVFICDRSNFSS